MTVSDLDIWRGAQALIKAYGEDAEFEAAARADFAIGMGDAVAEANWRRVLNAVRELQRQAPKTGEASH
jgi:hypothetical protein